jgi:hypothetical protein
MADHRESQVLGYILAALVVAISGIAVGLASTAPPIEVNSSDAGTAPADAHSPD